MGNKLSDKLEDSKLGTIVGIVILVVCVVLVAGMIYFGDKNNPSMGVFLFGLLFLIVGTSVVVFAGIDKDTILLLAFPLVGATVMTLSGAYMWGSEKIKSNIMLVLPFMGLAVFIIVGIVMIISTYIGHRGKLRSCSEIITAVCIGLNERYSRSRNGTSMVYAPVYNYYYNGQEHTVEEKTYKLHGVPEVGSEVELHIKPEVPENFYCPDVCDRLVSYMFGGVFVIMPAVCLVLYINQIK